MYSYEYFENPYSSNSTTTRLPNRGRLLAEMLRQQYTTTIGNGPKPFVQHYRVHPMMGGSILGSLPSSSSLPSSKSMGFLPNMLPVPGMAYGMAPHLQISPFSHHKPSFHSGPCRNDNFFPYPGSPSSRLRYSPSYSRMSDMDVDWQGNYYDHRKQGGSRRGGHGYRLPMRSPRRRYSQLDFWDDLEDHYGEWCDADDDDEHEEYESEGWFPSGLHSSRWRRF